MDMVKKYGNIIMLILLLVPLANATPTFKLNNCVELIQTCGNCSNMNISNVVYPNSSLALGFTNMTASNGYFNYTFCNANVTGDYIVNGKATIGGVDTAWAYNFKITHGGRTLTSQESSIYIIIIVALFFFFILGLIGAIKIPWKNGYTQEGHLVSVNDLKPVKIVVGYFTYLIGLLLVTVLYELSDAYTTLNAARGTLEVIHSVLYTLVYPLLIGIIVASVWIVIYNFKIQKLIERGFKL